MTQTCGCLVAECGVRLRSFFSSVRPMTLPLLTRIAHAAQPQCGCITARQLHALGIAHGRIVSLVERGALTAIFPSIYLFGATELSDAALLRASWLRAGPRSQLAELTALAVSGLAATDPSRHVVLWIPRRANDHGDHRASQDAHPDVATGSRRHSRFAGVGGSVRPSTSVICRCRPDRCARRVASRGHSRELSRGGARRISEACCRSTAWRRGSGVGSRARR